MKEIRLGLVAEIRKYTELIHKHLVGRFLLRRISTTERKSLHRFGEEYGEEALRLKLASILKRRVTDREWVRLREQMSKEAMEVAEKAIMRQRRRLKVQGQANIKGGEDRTADLENEWGTRLIRSVQPTVQSLVTLKFVNELLPNYFSETEIEDWTETISSNQTCDELVSELEARSGKDIGGIMSSIRDRVIREYCDALVGGVKDYAQIQTKQMTDPLSRALEAGNVQGLTKLFSQVS